MIPLTLTQVGGRLGERAPVQADMDGRIQAAVALVLAAEENRGLDLLLIKRAALEGDPWSGQMGLPGGRRESGDPDLLATAIRETAEETGIYLSEQELLGVLDDLAPTTPVLPPVAVRPFVFGLPKRAAVHPSPEVADSVWVSVGDLRRGANETTVTVRGRDLRVPAYFVGGDVVWGMTLRILNNFFDLAL
ncbi:MAG: CoA pyrophosphatase [Gemmatimonadota bacterium]|nr:CoA pyrophosphatase [Gemmatimonadota bacterium]MDH3366610.1 CoA pyrophosphatase [Gemmatimonadota bacterium]MDH3476864.1 CoA pyrophosphatase [Gemmatimonadota bacterium]MDH3569482.1 CoA pyrophosphatase [Gemmatimonadota bacterium]MDH5548488.1 CoA pyrophosphatase [Gemmatimonadota bacterium]